MKRATRAGKAAQELRAHAVPELGSRTHSGQFSGDVKFLASMGTGTFGLAMLGPFFIL